MKTMPTAPYRQRTEQNIELIFQIAEWLSRYPNCHPDMRRDRLKLWADLEAENQRLESMWDEAMEKWKSDQAREECA